MVIIDLKNLAVKPSGPGHFPQKKILDNSYKFLKEERLFHRFCREIRK